MREIPDARERLALSLILPESQSRARHRHLVFDNVAAREKREAGTVLIKTVIMRARIWLLIINGRLNCIIAISDAAPPKPSQ